MSLLFAAVVTAYCSCASCCAPQDRGEVGMNRTASGTRPVVGRTVAGPRSVPFGTWVILRVPGRKPMLLRVEDRTAPRYDGRWDVFVGTHREAKQFGRREGKVNKVADVMVRSR